MRTTVPAPAVSGVGEVVEVVVIVVEAVAISLPARGSAMLHLSVLQLGADI